jgi:hypothetical protein
MPAAMAAAFAVAPAANSHERNGFTYTASRAQGPTPNGPRDSSRVTWLSRGADAGLVSAALALDCSHGAACLVDGQSQPGCDRAVAQSVRGELEDAQLQWVELSQEP